MVPETPPELLGSSEVNLQSTLWALQLQSIFTEDALKIQALLGAGRLLVNALLRLKAGQPLFSFFFC